MPDLVGVFGELDAFQFSLSACIEDANLYLGSVCRKQGKVCALLIPICAAGVGRTLPDPGLYDFRQGDVLCLLKSASAEVRFRGPYLEFTVSSVQIRGHLPALGHCVRTGPPLESQAGPARKVRI